jgi:glucose dehydrogenase (acceptor)
MFYIALKYAKRIGEDPLVMKRLNSQLIKAPFPGCEEKEIYSDAYWECYARHWTQTIFHPVGTCSMGPKDSPAAVVDSKLRVKGVRKLRVIDASVMPFIPTGNTHAPTLMVGAHGADLVLKAWSRETGK